MSNTTNPPSNIFVATSTATGKIVQIIVHHQSQNGRDMWTASSDGVRGITQSNFSAAGAASQMADMMRCEGLTEVSLQPAAPPAAATKKDQTPEEEFVELLKDYALALTAKRFDPSIIGHTHWKLTEFVKALVEENNDLKHQAWLNESSNPHPRY